MSPSLRGCLVMLVFCAACGGHLTASRTVTGDCLFQFTLDDNSVQSFTDCKGTTLTSYGLDSSGQWVQVDSAAMTATGFTLGAPAGRWLLGVKFSSFTYTEFFETAADHVSLGAKVLGRPSGTSANAPTKVTFSLEGLEAWDGQDRVELNSSNACTARSLVYPTGTATLPAGASAGLASTDFNGSVSHLPDGSQGDVVFVHQLATRAIAGTAFSYQAASRFAQLPPTFRVVNGSPLSVNVSLAAIAPTGSLSLDWRTTEFEAHLAELSPMTRAATHRVLVEGQAHQLADLPQCRAGTPDMLWLELPPGTPDQQLPGLSYGQFLPQLWHEYRAADLFASVLVSAPSAQAAAFTFVVSHRLDPLPSSEPVRPLVGPPRSPQVGGRDGFSGPTGVGTTPTFSWSAPSVGTPTRYVLQLLEVLPSGTGGTTFSTAGYLATASTSARLPAGVLQSGTLYLARVTAFLSTPETFETAPYRNDIPSASAETVFTFTP